MIESQIQTETRGICGKCGRRIDPVDRVIWAAPRPNPAPTPDAIPIDPGYRLFHQDACWPADGWSERDRGLARDFPRYV